MAPHKTQQDRGVPGGSVMAPATYAIALGSNRPHGRYGNPAAILRAALAALDAVPGIDVVAVSPTIRSAPIGPSRRAYANAAAILSTQLAPPELLALLKQMERAFGRRSGQRWGTRVLDLDIILWSGGSWTSPTLSIPHPRWSERNFVLGPLLSIAPAWRAPRGAFTVRQQMHRLTRNKPR